MAKHKKQNLAPTLRQKAFLSCLLASYFYVLMEWLFFITKPSMFSTMPFWKALLLFGTVSLALSLLTVLTQAVLESGSLLAHKAARRPLPPGVFFIPAAGLLTVLLLILVDNFSYTIFHFGIMTTKSAAGRCAYVIALGAAFWLILKKLEKSFSELSAQSFKRLSQFSAALIALSVVATGIRLTQSSGTAHADLQLEAQSDTPQNEHQLPNVLLLSSDGINARNTSAYGYERDTTPFLKQLSEQSVLFENAFSNSSSTYSSLLSTLTGELPMKMNVLAFPDILIGPSAYQHLPALLRKLGYSNLQLSMRYYADAADANMRYGFQKANFRDLEDSPAEILISKGYALPLADIQFFSRLTSRAKSRLSHLIGLQWMDNASQVFTFTGMEDFLLQARTQDPKRIHELLSFAQANDKTPWFAQVHLLGTHCCGFFPEIRKYSSGKTQDESNFTDFYDDAILQADAYFRQIIEGLEKLHQLDNTLIIISSDHGDHWLVREKVPLMIRFPGAKYRGRVRENVQLLDIAPTILDVLGYKAPSWMSGISLVPGHSKLNPLRPIFSLAGFEDGPKIDEKLRVLNAQRQPAAFNVVLCQKWNTLIQSEHKVIGGDVISHTSPCKDSPLLSIQTGAALLETVTDSEAL